MALAKNIARVILWALRLGMAFLWPFLAVLTMITLGTVWNTLLVWKVDFFWLGMSFFLLVLAATGGYIAWRCDLALPLDRPKIDQPRLARWAIGFFTANCLSLAILVGLDWMNSTSATQNNTVGLTLYFVDENTFHLFYLLSAFSSAILLLMLLISIVRNSRQLRLIVSLISLFSLVYPAALIGYFYVTREKKMPLWMIKHTTTGPDNNTYSFLREGPIADGFFDDGSYESADKFSALARHTGGSLFVRKVQIILLDKQTQHPKGALMQGTKHKDVNVRRVSEKLLKIVK